MNIHFQSKKNNKVLCFRGWRRKGYAIYNSLGRQIKIGVLATSCSLVSLSLTAGPRSEASSIRIESEAESDTLDLEEVLVVSTAPGAFPELSRVVTSISQSELRRLPLLTLSDLLSTVASLDIRQRGPSGVQADIFIRGGGFDQNLILLNGINLTDPQTGHHNLNLPIDLQDIGRVEILQGPGARVLGPNAFSGAINLITEEVQHSGVSARIEGGDHRSLNLNAQGVLNHKNWRGLVSVGHQTSDGYSENTDYSISNAYLSATYRSATFGRLNFQSGYQDKSFGANGFYSLAYPHQYEQVRTWFNAVSYRRSGDLVTWQSQLYHRQSLDRFELFRSDPAPWYTGHNYHRSDVAGGNIRADFRLNRWKTAIGTDVRGEHIFSTVLGEQLSQSKPVGGEPAGVFYTKAKWRTLINSFVEQAYYGKHFQASLGWMGSWSNDYGFFHGFGLDVSVPIFPSFSWIASFNRSMRLPTFTDLYYSGATQIGNPNLQVETALTAETGLRYRRTRWQLEGLFFYRRSANLIDWVWFPEEQVYHCLNHSLVHTLGIEVQGCYTFSGPVHRWVRDIRLSYAGLSMDLDSKGEQVSRTLDYLKHHLTLSNTLQGLWKLQLTWSLGYELRALERHSLFFVDAKIAWVDPRFQIYVQGKNLLGTVYADFTGLEQSGRWFWAGLSVNIQFNKRGGD